MEERSITKKFIHQQIVLHGPNLARGASSRYERIKPFSITSIDQLFSIVEKPTSTLALMRSPKWIVRKMILLRRESVSVFDCAVKGTLTLVRAVQE